jgi:hypothetical protein
MPFFDIEFITLDKYYFYHGFGLKAFEGRHIRIVCKLFCWVINSISKNGIGKVDIHLSSNYNDLR